MPIDHNLRLFLVFLLFSFLQKAALGQETSQKTFRPTVIIDVLNLKEEACRSYFESWKT